MTLQEAIRLLDPETTGEAIAEIEYYNGFSGKKAAIQAITEASVIACEAMRKRIPEKPKLLESKVFYECPCCKRVVSKREPSHGNNVIPYCKWCGQAWDWSDDNA